MRYRAVIEPGRESGYVAYVPALRGCVSQGETPEEAFANIREAAEAYVESLIEDNQPLPPEVYALIGHAPGSYSLSVE